MEYKQCNRCVMDTTATEIIFDNKGNCNFCNNFLKKLNIQSTNKIKLKNSLIKRIKKDGQGKKYDCIVGVSGGVDSSYVLYLAKKEGLRILAVHMDNGWNSELATNNISNLVNELNIDLYTHVIDWEEYRDMMESFFKANVIDIELLYDNAMTAVNFNLARKYKIKYILSGQNLTTEGMQMPKSWNWLKLDAKNIKSIHKKFGKQKIKTFPLISTIQWVYCEYVKGIKWLPLLDYFEYNKNKALNLLENQYGYKPYPYKHYESVFTRFYQGYILPNKFNIDKRKLHLSTLICSNQLTREEALKSLESIPYNSKEEQEEDIEYFLKKMKWDKQQLDEYIKNKEVSHDFYPSEKKVYDFLKNVYFRFIKK